MIGVSRGRRPHFRPVVAEAEARWLSSTVPVAAVVFTGGFDTARFPAERRDLHPGDFPNLGRRFEVIAPFSDRYNCIAWTVGDKGRWITPTTGSARVALAWADRVYGRAGFTRSSSLDTTQEPGVTKVVVYGFTSRQGTIREIKHAALQQADGTWTSKMGRGGLIRHATPQAVSGPLYGRPILVYRRVN